MYGIKSNTEVRKQTLTTYKNFEITEEPAEDPDPSAADSIARFELQNPFGQ